MAAEMVSLNPGGKTLQLWDFVVLNEIAEIEPVPIEKVRP